MFEEAQISKEDKRAAYQIVSALCKQVDTHLSKKEYAEAYDALMKDQDMLTKNHELLFRCSVVSFHLGKHFDVFAMRLPKEASSATYFGVAKKALSKAIALNTQYDDYTPLLDKALEEAKEEAKEGAQEARMKDFVDCITATGQNSADLWRKATRKLEQAKVAEMNFVFVEDLKPTP